MNILVLNGSPRPHGNTAALVDIFTDEAQKAGHHVTVFQIGNKDIRGCKNCDACRATLNGNCVQKDDIQEIYPVMRECRRCCLLQRAVVLHQQSRLIKTQLSDI